MSILSRTYVSSISQFFMGFQNSANSENIRMILATAEACRNSNNMLIIALSIGWATPGSYGG